MEANFACSLFLVPLIALIIWSSVMKSKLSAAVNKATMFPTEENVIAILEILSKRVRPGIRNHPDEWKKLRNMFYNVNGSSNVTTPLKKDLKDCLVKCGLYIDNMKIIDNYKRR